MTATFHRWAMTLAAIATGLGGLIAIPDFAPLGIPAEVGIACIFAGSAITLVATAVRANADPQSTPAS